MTDRVMLIIDAAGLLIAVAGLVLGKLMARNRARYLASRTRHPAE